MKKHEQFLSVESAEIEHKKEVSKFQNHFKETSICRLETHETSIDRAFEKAAGFPELYIPKATDPLTFICVNLHVFQDSNGGTNYNKSHIQDFKRIFSWMNGYLTNYHTPNYLGTCTAHPSYPQQIDSRIRYILNRIEFYQDDALCNTGAFQWSPLKNAMIARDPDMENQLNIFLTAPPPQGFGGYASPPSTNLSAFQYVHSFKQHVHDNPPFWLSQHWSHELGHVFNLNHTYNQGIGGGQANCNQTDPFYLHDIFGCGVDTICPIPTNQDNNNVMGGKESWSYSTMQIAQMHYALKHLSTGKYSTDCCGRCTAFGARFKRHISEGNQSVIQYDYTTANENYAWDGQRFTCPSSGIYFFSISFQKDSLVQGGTPDDVWIKIIINGETIATAWSEKSDRRTGWSPFGRNQQFGRRDSVSASINIDLDKGDIVHTLVGSDKNKKRHLVDGSFCGHIVCPDCS